VLTYKKDGLVNFSCYELVVSIRPVPVAAEARVAVDDGFEEDGCLVAVDPFSVSLSEGFPWQTI